MIYGMEKLKGLNGFLQHKLIGQHHAVEEVARYLVQVLSLPERKGRIRGSLLILGPTGTGKTEIVMLSKAYIFGERGPLERIDLGDYAHGDAPVRLLGGREAKGSLRVALERLASGGGGILLLDELEKAHASVWPVLLGFDSGRVSFPDGEVMGLEQVLLVATSNLGSAEAARMEAAPDAAVERHILRVAERALRPEVFARFGLRVVFRRLDAEAQRAIAGLRVVEELAWRRSFLGVRVRVTGDAVVQLAAEGFTRELGARPLRNVVEARLGEAFREHAGDFGGGVDLVLDAVDGRLRLAPLDSLRRAPRVGLSRRLCPDEYKTQ